MIATPEWALWHDLEDRINLRKCNNLETSYLRSLTWYAENSVLHMKVRIVKVSPLKLSKFQTVMIITSLPAIYLWFLYWRVKLYKVNQQNSNCCLKICHSQGQHMQLYYQQDFKIEPRTFFILGGSYVQSMLAKFKLIVW